MSIKVLRVHYNTDLSGGAEFDILKLIDVFAKNGLQNDLILISKENGHFWVQNWRSPEKFIFTKETDLKNFLLRRIELLCYTHIHIHSMPYYEVTKILLNIGLPVFRSMHEPMLVCPGWSKFLLESQDPCTSPFGPACFIKAYTEKCNRSRKPKRLIYSYKNTKFEQTIAIPRYEKIFVYSDFMRETAIQAGVPEEKLVKIPSPQQFVEAKKKVSVGDEVRILFCGRLNKQKGLHLLMNALKPLCGLYNILLYVVGSGSDEGFFREKAKEMNISNFIKFQGWKSRTELFDIYSEVDFVCIPSIYPDNFPNVVAEAMVHENPVVTFDVGGTAEWYIDGVHGFKIPNKDVEGLRSKIEYLIKNPDQKIGMGKEARKWIYKNHSFDRTFKEYMKVYGA